jgi:hypothetical protein
MTITRVDIKRLRLRIKGNPENALRLAEAARTTIEGSAPEALARLAGKGTVSATSEAPDALLRVLHRAAREGPA